MKPATVAARQTIERDNAIKVRPRLRAEWEHNRFSEPTITVTPAQTGNDEWLVTYDLNTVGLPSRPTAGIAKARTGSSKVKPASAYRDSTSASRFYPSDPEDIYKYWSSIQKSGTVLSNGGYAFSTPIAVAVDYGKLVQTNKIVVGFETSYAKPVEYTIQTSTNGTDWMTVSTNPPLSADGTATIWFDGDSWDHTASYANNTTIKAVRVQVFSMNAPASHVDMLQLGARLENDLSDLLISYTVGMEVSDREFIAPLGRASSNIASIQLSNIDGRFNNDNAVLNGSTTANVYYGLIDKKVRFTMDVGVDTTPRGGSGYEYIREFRMWADTWGGQEQSIAEVTLKDSSVFLQEQEIPPVFYENYTVGAIVWSVMDRIGFTNYAYTRVDDETGQIIPFFWPEDTGNTVWDQFGELARATQTAIYFDENDILQIRSRRSIYADKAVDWNFDAVHNGLKLPDIVSVQVDREMEANHVDVMYSPASYSEEANIPKMETAWEPEEDTIVLRASSMQRNLATTGTDLWIKQAEAVFWPFESLVNIRGEILSYRGKEYGYYRANGTLAKKVVFSLDEQNALDELNSNLSFKNAYTGRLVVSERGLYGTPVGNHTILPTNYTDIVTASDNSTIYSWNGRGRQYRDGYLYVTQASADKRIYHLVKHSSNISTGALGHSWFGTRLRFSDAGEGDWNVAGLYFAGGDIDEGYYLEFSTTSHIEIQEKRGSRHEIYLRAMPSNAPGFTIPGVNGDPKGYKAAIVAGTWYDIDVRWHRNSNSTISIYVWVNGVKAAEFLVQPGQRPPNSGRFGMFVRGATRADFEYLYAFTEDDTNPLRDPDQTNFLDLRSGGYSSGHLEREIKWNYRFIRPSLTARRRRLYFPQHLSTARFLFDEFGPVVHEVREFDVQFAEEMRPVAHSFLYLSNSGQVESVFYESDAFGARFLLANAARHNVVVKGEDQTTFTSENPVDQAMFIYGRSVYQEEEKKLTKTDELSIRRRGVSKVEFSSRFIQTEDMANKLGDWIIELWATGVDEVTLECFGNPLLQLGDVVTINHPAKDMAPATHKYFVVSIDRSFDRGYSMTVTLRRARF